MKTTTERDAIIYDMWAIHKMSFSQISTQKIPLSLSLKRIQNIIYGGPSRLNTENEKSIYRIYRLKFLEFQDIGKAILFTYENQPTSPIHVRTIRRIISNKLKSKKNKT